MRHDAPSARTRRAPEPISKAGAERIAAQLDAYWHSLGHANVRHWTEIAYRDGEANNPFWTVRSNLVGGNPPKPEAAP